MKYFYKKKQEKGTSVIKSMPQSAQNDTYNFCKNSKKCTKNLSFLRKPRVFKALAASGLALFMGAGVLCGVLVAPGGGGSAAASMTRQSSQSGLSAGQNASGAATALTSQEKLLSGQGLGLAPENDPVVYTTDYGLEIKLHLTGYKADPSTLDKIPSGQRFANYAYVEAAGIKWVILGYSSFIANGSLSGYLDIENILSIYSSFIDYNKDSIWQFLQEERFTPAGTAIFNEYKTGKNTFYSNTAVDAIYENVPETLFPYAVKQTNANELSSNEILCFAQDVIGDNVPFNNSSNNNYAGSNIEEYLSTWYEENLKSSLGAYISSKSLYTLYGNSDSTVNAKLFLLAARSSSESFYYGNYGLVAGSLSGANMKCSAYWTLRSGTTDSSYSYGIHKDNGSLNTKFLVTSPYGVRPAFVLKI